MSRKQIGDYYTTDRLTLFTGNHICIVKSRQLADSAIKLLSDNEDDLTRALGLLTFAIEEFGKAVFLKECFVDHEEAVQKIPRAIFKGKESHELKFSKAMEKLPPDCKKIFVGRRVVLPSGRPMTLRLGKSGPYVTVPPDTSGNFFAEYAANFDVRMNCFYADWDEKEEKWMFNMKVRREDLQKAMSSFKKHIMDYHLVIIKQRERP
jgi:AbiV family abortive infection protein